MSTNSSPNSLEVYQKTAHTVLKDLFSKQAMTAIGRAASTRTTSEAQNGRHVLASTLGYTFKHVLTPAQQNEWFLAGQKMVDLSGNPRPKDAYTAFFTTNSLIYSILGAGHILLSPGSLTPPAPLPQVDLAASNVGGAFRLRVLSDAAYTGASLQCLAAPSVVAGKDFYRASAFVPLTVIDGLVAGTFGVDIGAAFAQKYAVPAAGRKIALKLRPITNTGVAGPYYLLTSIVGLTEAASSGTDDTGTDKTDMGGALHVV